MRLPFIGTRRSFATVFAVVLLGASAHAAELGVMTSGAFTAALLELKPVYEGKSGNKLTILTTTMGTGTASIPNRLERGEAADVVIVDDTSLEDLIARGLVVAGTRVPLARSLMGMAVRAGAPKPDISSVEAFRNALLQAKSIAYSASVSGRYLSTEVFPRLEIAEQLAGKARRIEGERVGAVVARGEAEIGFQQVSELLPVPGIDYVGPLPPGIQKATIFSAGIPKGSMNRDAAAELIRFLGSADSSQVITRTGIEAVVTNAVK